MSHNNLTKKHEELLQKAKALSRSGKLLEATEIYQDLLIANPLSYVLMTAIGAIALKIGHVEYGLKMLGNSLELVPDQVDVLCNIGIALAKKNRLDEALACYDRAIALNPGFAQAHLNRGNLLRTLGRPVDALSCYERVIALDPNFVGGYVSCGNVLRELGRLDAALASYEQAVVLKPKLAISHLSLGNVLRDLKRFDAALASYKNAISLEPEYAEAHHNLGIVLQELKRLDEALEHCECSIALRPGWAEAYVNRGKIFYDLRRFQDAINDFMRAIDISPELMEAHLNMGIMLHELKLYDQALVCFDKVVNINPLLVDAYINRASVFRSMKLYKEALDNFEKASEINPNALYILSDWLHVKMLICDWSGIDSCYQRIIMGIDRGEKASHPFPLLAMNSTPNQQLRCAHRFIQDKFPSDRDSHWYGGRYEHKRIRLGYFSSDFGDHPVSYLTAGLFEHHDRSRFEVIAFSTGKPSGDGIQQRLRKAFDQFIDVEERSDREVAQLAKEMEIDIAVDMNGHTSGARTGVFALRPAPIQVNYLGYPGTLGAEYMDYIIADRTVIPVEHQVDYTEHVVYLPHCFQVNDATKVITEPGFSRSELGLPEQGFVFCCFNNNYKLTPDLFEVWMRLLKQVQGSVLWLQGGNPTVVANLRREAEQHGVSPDRLIFASRMEKLADHLARHRQADLFLDTLYYNAHTTASDALWAGLPVLTCLGKTYASRVAASLLETIGLPELITHSLQEYEALALALATDPDRLAATKEKLACHRTTYPLFDTALFTKHIEAAYSAMWGRYQKGLPAETIYIDNIKYKISNRIRMICAF